MPQDGSNNYQYPPGTPGVPDQTIESEAYNTFLDDLVVNDLNWPRPVHRGGTGATTANKALINLASEKATQLVTNYDAHVWLPGSFRSSNATGQGAPVDGHAFAGICYLNESYVDPPTNENVVVEARDLDGDASLGSLYVRHKDEGVWGDWVQQVAGPTRNRIVNGAMQISQENGNTAGTTTAYYAADQWTIALDTAGTITTQRVQLPTVNNSRDRLRTTITVADATLDANNCVVLLQTIEGSFVADFCYGTPVAKQSIVRFGWRSPAGTYSIAIRNAAADRSYVANFTISASEADTNTEQTIIIPGDPSGTWLADTNAGLSLLFVIASGSTYQCPAGWNAGNFFGTSSNTNGMAIPGNVFELFDVGLYFDIDNTGVAPKWEMPDPAQELATCQRYYENMDRDAPSFAMFADAYSGAGDVTAVSSWVFKVPKRVVPSLVPFGTFTQVGNSGGLTSIISKANVTVYQLPATASTRHYFYNDTNSGFIANARL